MYDILPFPLITSKTSEGQINELLLYLTQFKETLEFALMNISVDNLSQDLVEKLNALGADIEKSNESREDEMTQFNNNALTKSDVVNTISAITFSVNFDTGKLEYFMS